MISTDNFYCSHICSVLLRMTQKACHSAPKTLLFMIMQKLRSYSYNELTVTCQSWITFSYSPFPTLLQATAYWLEDQHGAMALLHLYLVVLCTLDLEKAQAARRWPGDVTVLVR